MRRSDITRRERPEEDTFYESMPVATPLAGRRTRIVEEPVEDRGLLLAERVVGYVTWLVSGILTLRLILVLFADGGIITTTSGFARFIYGLSDPLVRPFATIFSTTSYDPNAWAVGFALIVYALIGYAIARLIRIAAERNY